jgi:hypothetical protein
VRLAQAAANALAGESGKTLLDGVGTGHDGCCRDQIGRKGYHVGLSHLARTADSAYDSAPFFSVCPLELQ